MGTHAWGGTAHIWQGRWKLWGEESRGRPLWSGAHGGLKGGGLKLGEGSAKPVPLTAVQVPGLEVWGSLAGFS